MKKITVISGKGGTGKTTVISNMAALAENLVLADCDVDAPNMHLLLKPEITGERIFKSGKLAVRDESKCTECYLCLEFCRFGAISANFEINPIKCDGCGVCAAFCPAGAIVLEEQETGYIYISESEFGPMIHARLKAGADNSGKLVSEVRKEADKVAKEKGMELILIDGSPGIGCPVIASLNGVDAALIVTEPTRSGLSDLKRVLEVTRHFGIPAMVVTNKYDLNEGIVAEIEEYCWQMDIPVIGRIPFDPVVNQSLRDGELLIRYREDSKPAQAIKTIWQKFKETMVL
ncbi:MAG: hypothetical protein PWR10_115 [Halanaerobiales bacterium]|nr:hypothetical protein [Halanaerobiales bacterium]